MDVVVTVPKNLWFDWIDEGDAAGTPETGEEWGFYLSNYGPRPNIKPGDRVYIVAFGRLRGYAPLTRLNLDPLCLCRRGGAVAVTIDEEIRGFQGWRYRWWDRGLEVPFPDWRQVKRKVKEQGRLF
jgi:hypothetical protein